jgi:CDP-diacylglycerol---serine O-phosphatidyltransferase
MNILNWQINKNDFKYNLHPPILTYFHTLMKIIPNLFTLLNLFFGCIALICILQNGITIIYSPEGTQYADFPERIWLAPLFIGLAAIVDFLDGFVARLLNHVSPLGRELDSLADVVSFGVAPGLIIYQFLRLSFMGQDDGADVSMIWLLPALILPCAAAYRLAVFNLDTTQSRSFKGVPVPAVGLMVASFPLIYWTRNSNWILNLLLNKWILYAIVIFLSLAMISRIPMLSMKFDGKKDPQLLPRLILIILSLISIFILQWLAVPLIFLFYIVISLLFKNKIA